MFLERFEKEPEAIAIASLEYPFLSTALIDEGLDTLTIFNSESVISVTSNKGPFYRHTGKSLKAIFDQDKYTSYERESLYQSVGGLMVATYLGFKKHNRLIGERVSHLLVNEEHSFGVLSNFQFELFKRIVDSEKMKHQGTADLLSLHSL
ncbi:family 2 glycosyl transferase [Nitritalea halalkaliphila LW7]|uniref:Family 2 glycosyl transferase n=1 Tax=Nitritalea halalkaliphila LW7 TaxID=1189621 RepID=I5C620_9BACT|nr:family 2 glycosyl transferase [Nitritalea halalkaliphila]EIM77272.1 family 2 glycosyl transferase [Nitritalea halalkaliphila LW7]